MKLRNWTFFVYLSPENYLSDKEIVTNLDLEEWSREKYQWQQDGWNGLKDFARDPAETVFIKRGDCEDYALVAASWGHYNGYDVTLGFCMDKVIPRHVVTEFDGDVYSSGVIYRDKTIEEFIEMSQFDWYIGRKVK